MAEKIFRLIIPILVFLIMLMDINRSLKVYKSDRNTMKFKIARVFIVIALLISLILGLVNLLGHDINKSLVYYSKIFNAVVLIIYLLFIRFKRN